MNFNSWAFAAFLPIVFLMYWILPHKFRWFVILVSSYYFYMCWNAKYIVLMLFTTVISYATALLLEKTEKTRIKKLWITCALVASLGVLFFFKYFNFLSESVANAMQAVSIPMNPITLKVILPVGISFYTFQTLGYVLDVYRGDVKAERHFGKYAAFISFFPQLVAGPIERTSNLLPQIQEPRKFDYSKAVKGCWLMAWGFFKKMAISDSLAVYVNRIYNNLPEYEGAVLIFATILFAIQIYCDFSGYSDIAIGTAKLFGVDLMTNFKSPYLSASVKEFWSRWHISLSTWFRDYVYIPLGGNRVGKFRHKLNLIITFLISGLWHGANWNFVIWGGIHGVVQALETMFLPKKKGVEQKHNLLWIVRVLIVFAFCCIAWIFFRAQNFSEAMYVITRMNDGLHAPMAYLRTGFERLGFVGTEWIKYAVMIVILIVHDYVALKKDIPVCMEKAPKWVRWMLYLVIIWVIMLVTPFDSTSAFIYFQF